MISRNEAPLVYIEGMQRRRWLDRALVFVALASVFGLAFTKITDPDLGFHLATGRAVLALGRVPATNVLSFTEPDHRWLLHEWAPAVMFELASRAAGPRGLLALKEIVIVATWSLVLATAHKRGASVPAAALATILGAGAASIRFVERPQIFSDLALAAVGLFLARANARAEEETRGRRRDLGAAAMVVAAAWQLHAGAIVAWVRMLCEAAGALFEPIRARLFRDERRVPCGARRAIEIGVASLAAVALAAVVITIVNPNGARVMLVPFSLGSDLALREHVVEYRSPLTFPFDTLHLFWAFAFHAALFALVRARRTPARDLATIVAFSILTLRFVRVVDSFAIAIAPIFAEQVTRAFPSVAPPRLAALLGLLALPIAIALPLDRWSDAPPGAGFYRNAWPVALLDFADREAFSGRAFVSDAWAGPYLADRYPRDRAFFDARFEAYSRAFVEDVYRRIRYGEPGWDSLLDKYEVEWILLKYTSPAEAEREHGKPNVRQLLANDDRWALVAFDEFGEIFVRRRGVNGERARQLAIMGVDPDRGAIRRGAATQTSLHAALERGVDNPRLLSLLALATVAIGDKRAALEFLDRADRESPGDPEVKAAREAVEDTLVATP